jgi:hypothetical protein
MELPDNPRVKREWLIDAFEGSRRYLGLVLPESIKRHCQRIHAESTVLGISLLRNAPAAQIGKESTAVSSKPCACRHKLAVAETL